MDIVLITTLSRPFLLGQSVGSLVKSAPREDHRLTVVIDGYEGDPSKVAYANSTILLSVQQGASASRNIGAASIPKYRRQKRVMFLDDDVYMCPNWDARIEEVMDLLPGAIVSGHSHPFNHPLANYSQNGVRYHAAGVLSTVHMAMDWDVWDDVGWWAEPGGPGGSEDVDFCRRAVEKGYGLAVVEPECVIHCGTRSSSGKDIVGRDLVIAKNERLVKEYGLEGVRWE